MKKPGLGEEWVSKETGLVVKIVRTDAKAVWWENREVCLFPCNTQADIFLRTMIRKDRTKPEMAERLAR